MKRRAIAASDAPAPEGGYAQAVLTEGAQRILHVSGQIPVDRDGSVPVAFGDQCRLAWRNLAAQLRAAGMGLDDLVKVTTFLSDRAHAAENGAIRREVLGAHRPALTVLVAGIFDPAWQVEIEAVAIAPAGNDP
ncbi:MAG: RidA family protein [Alphaproteobacteria bacterium]